MKKLMILAILVASLVSAQDTKMGSIATKGLNGIRFADQYATGGSGTSGSPWTGWESSVNSAPTGTRVYFRDGYYSFSTTNLAPTATAISIIGSGWGTILQYSGSGWAYDVNTLQKQNIQDLNITLGTSSLGCARYQHITSSSEANNRMRHVLCSASVNTSGQIGMLLYTTAAGDSNYHNDLEMQTLNVNIGAQLLSAVNSNGSNGNTIHITCNLHKKCLDWRDGTDEDITVDALGGYNYAAGDVIGADLCAAGGGYGIWDSNLKISKSEQGVGGGGSIGVKVESTASTCGNINVSGIANDAITYSDANATPITTISGPLGPHLINPTVYGNSAFLGFGFPRSSSTVGLKRSSTSLLCRLGDDSDYCSGFAAGKYQVSINSTATDALTSHRLYLGNNSNIRQGSIWAGNTASNLYTMSYMTNNTTSDGATYTSFLSSYGSWVYECVSNTTDSNSKCGWYYRNAGAADGKGTQQMSLSNAGVLTVNGLSTGGTPTANHAVCWKTSTTLGYCSTAPDASGICTCN